MRQTKKRSQWYFRTKGDFGVDGNTTMIEAGVLTVEKSANGSVGGELRDGAETEGPEDKVHEGQREPTAAPAARRPEPHPR